jgi:hypothetical protein
VFCKPPLMSQTTLIKTPVISADVHFIVWKVSTSNSGQYILKLWTCVADLLHTDYDTALIDVYVV